MKISIDYTKTPYQRWVERTNDGRELAAGWVSTKYDPTQEGEYEVQGHPKRSYLTWAYGRWWYMDIPEHGGIPYWHHNGDKRYVYQSKRRGPPSYIHWADLVIKAFKLGNPEAREWLVEQGCKNPEERWGEK